MPPESQNVLKFGPYSIDREQRLLTTGSDVIPLAPKVFDTLLVLVESGGRLLEKENLLKKVWPDAFVEEGSLARNISTLRKALGENPHDQKYIVTVPKRGYRFVVDVTSGGVPGKPAGGLGYTAALAREQRAAFEHPNHGCLDHAIAQRPPEPSILCGESRTFVGRERETKRLAGHFQRMVDGHGNLVFLTGEAGIGKSAVAEQFVCSVRRQYPGIMLACGRAVEQYGAGEAYLPFLDALSALLRDGGIPFRSIFRDHAPTWCLQLPAFSSSGDSDQLRRETAGATKDRMLREMGDALGALSSAAPLVLLLEDLHWADPSTLGLLRHLSNRIAAQRVLLLVTFRPEDIQNRGHSVKNCKIEMQAHHLCDEIALDVLSAEDVAELLNLRFQPNDFSNELAGLIWKRTDGQPLFTVSLLEFLVSRGEIARVDSHWTLVPPLAEIDLEIPDSVRAMIRKKSEALDAGSRLALQYASVQGEEFLSTVLAELLDNDDLTVEEQLASLAETHHLIEVRGEEELPDGVLTTRYAFRHALYQNVFYDELVSKRRALLHGRAGEELLRHYGDLAPRIAVQLAMHFERGRNWIRAIEFLLIAGSHASSIQANMQAEQHYTHALGLTAKLPREIRAETEFRIYDRRAGVYLATSRFDASIADCKEMIDRARTIGSLELECAARYTLGNVLFWAHRLHDMRSVLEDVSRLAERTQSDAARLKALALMAQGDLTLGSLNDAERKVVEVVDEVIAQASLVDTRTMLGVLDVQARLRYFQSEYRTAEKLFRETLNRASQLGDAFEMLKSQYFLCLTLANLGRISEALEVLNSAMEMSRRNGDFFWSARMPNCLGWIHRELQDVEGAMVFDREGAETARSLGIGEAEINSVINLSFDCCQAGDKQGTCSAMTSAESLLSQHDWFRWRYKIRFQASRAEQTLSRQEALRLLEKAAQYRAHKYMVVAHTLLARIAMAEGDMAAAEAQSNAAIGILHEFPAPLVAWKTYSIQGRIQAQLGREKAACAAFGEATSIITYIADHIGDERLRRIFLGSAAVRQALSCGLA